MQKKVVVLYGLVLLAFVGLSGRLVWITRKNENKYQKQVLSQQGYSSTVIPYRRGNILDARGTRLATSEKVYNLVIDARVMTSKVKDEMKYLEPTLQALGEYFDLDMVKIREYVNTNQTSSWYVPLRQLTYEQISGFQEAQAQEGSNIKGVWFEEEYKRIYPYGSLAADAIGFTTADGQGSYGLEEYYNDVLNGVDGREYGYLNDDLAMERTVKSAVDGYDIHSTIDANLQMIVEKNLKKFNDEHQNKVRAGNGAENVGCIMMNANTGEVIAMASYPTYDLNDTRNPQAMIGSRMVEQVTNANGYYEIKKTNTIIDQNVIDAMESDELYLNLNYLWKNYCITDTYEPGSTAKPFTVAAALEQGAVSPNTSFECTGVMEVGGYPIRCHAQGHMTLENAIATSCNVTMMKIAQLMGKEYFCKFQNIFNFGLRTNIDLAGEARTASLIYMPEDMGPTDLATNSFGQNFNVTMIEMITGFCSLVNGGYYYEPHMVDKITNASGATVKNIEPRVLKQTVSESTSALIRQYCKAVVDYGTGTSAKPPGYQLGGKTGTAETIDPITNKRSENEYVVSFIGCVPAEDPEIAIYVVVDRLNAEKQDNARVATVLARSILMEALPYLNIFMTEPVSEAEQAELDALQMENTNKYTQTPEGTEPEDPEGGEPEGGEGEGNEGGTGDVQNAPWMDYPIDPETGYRVGPDNRYYDAQTGIPIEGESVPNPDIPVNPNLTG
ncbi:MAG: penicillin-binding protein 2 [Lachnospiraceae bacterium]|nr:penicillin-binding protein 2 [Lachnospiraceae bacterium]